MWVCRRVAPSRRPAATPYVAELDRRRLEVIECERARAVNVTATLRVRWAIAGERISQAEARLHVDLAHEADGEGAAQVKQCRVRLGELQNSRAAIGERIDRHCAAAQARALRFDEFMRRCCARYARSAIRRHPDGSTLSELGWPALGPVPAWVLDPCPTAALSAAGVASDGPFLEVTR